MTDQLVKNHKHGRKHEDYREHTDDRSSCHQITQGTDHINIGIKSDAKGCCKETQCTDNDGLNRAAVCNGNGFLLALSCTSFRLVTGGHQDRVVYRGSQLNRTNNNRCNERQCCMSVIRKTHINVNCKFNHADQNHRKTYGFKHKEDDGKNDSD